MFKLLVTLLYSLVLCSKGDNSNVSPSPSRCSEEGIPSKLTCITLRLCMYVRIYSCASVSVSASLCCLSLVAVRQWVRLEVDGP